MVVVVAGWGRGGKIVVVARAIVVAGRTAVVVVEVASGSGVVTVVADELPTITLP